MNHFLQRHADSVTGMLSGFDRLLFRGTLRMLATAKGLMGYLWSLQILLKDFGDWSQHLTQQIRAASEQVAHDAGRPIIYLNDPSVRKEDLVRRIAQRDKIDNGLICVLSAVEPCCSYDLHRNRAKKKLELVCRWRKCLHLYHYRIHPQLGFMHGRLQTWLPFNVKMCLNGREWLSRQMDAAGLGYVRRDNCFTALSDPARAQTLMDEQLKANWTGLLEESRRMIHPAHEAALASNPLHYYWSVDQSEWASDVMFKHPKLLGELYPRLIGHGMRSLASRDVMRFLGHKVPAHGGINGNFQGEVISDIKTRPEGLRLKHRVNRNSVKLYDKQGSVLRVETTLNDTRDFKVYRPAEGDPASKPAYRMLRKGIADLHRRAQVSDASNQRYLDALASVQHTAKLGDLLSPLCKAITWNGKRVRALHPIAGPDGELLAAVARGEFTLNGFRNRDLRELLYPTATRDEKEMRRRSGAITRKLRLLRAHGLIKKVPRTHRYVLTEIGRVTITAILAARDANPQQLIGKAA
jgi:hypothetical protein